MSHTDTEILLQSENEEERLQGLRQLNQEGIDGHLGLLYRAMGDASWRVRKEAAEVFLALPVAAELSGEIIELLHAEDNAGLRNTAVDILVRLGRLAVPRLLEELACPDHDVRKFVIDILGAIGDPSVGGALIAALADDDTNVRAAAAENLGRLQVVEAVPHLVAAMRTADLMTRFTILEALAQIGNEIPVADLLAYREEKLLRKALFDCLGHVGNGQAVPVLVEGLCDEMRNVREAAAVALGRLAEKETGLVEQAIASAADRVGPILGELVGSRHQQVTRAALQLIAWAGDAGVVPILLPLAGQEHLQRLVLFSLINIASRCGSSLLELWPNLDDSGRAYLVYALGEAGCRDCLPRVLEALQASSPELQQAAAHALGKVGDPETPARLVNVLVDCDSEVAPTVVSALASLAAAFPDQVIAAAGELLGREDERLRTEGVRVLSGVRDRDISDMISMALKDESREVRAAAIEACRGRDDDALWQQLLFALTDESADVRRMAVESIGASGRAEASEALSLALQDEDIWVRSTAVRALGQLGSEEACGLVREQLGDPVGLVVIACLESLVAAGVPDANDCLRNALDHEDRDVVIAALKQLGWIGDRDWVEIRGRELLNHKHWEVRLATARTLVEVGAENGLTLLEERLLVEEEDLVQKELKLLAQALMELRES